MVSKLDFRLDQRMLGSAKFGRKTGRDHVPAVMPNFTVGPTVPNRWARVHDTGTCAGLPPSPGELFQNCIYAQPLVDDVTYQGKVSGSRRAGSYRPSNTANQHVMKPVQM